MCIYLIIIRGFQLARVDFGALWQPFCFGDICQIFCLLFSCLCQIIMASYTIEQHVQMIKLYYQNECSLTQTLRALRPFFGRRGGPSNFLWPILNHMDLDDMWFQQDGATCHTANAILFHFNIYPPLLKNPLWHNLGCSKYIYGVPYLNPQYPQVWQKRESDKSRAAEKKVLR